MEAKAFLLRFRGLSSEGILEALTGLGKSNDWFATEIVGMIENNPSNPRIKLRVLELIQKIVQQKEGEKHVHTTMDELEDKELQGLMSSMANKMVDAGIDMHSFMKEAEIDGLTTVAERAPAILTGSQDDKEPKQRDCKALQAPTKRQNLASIPSKGTRGKGRKSKR